MEKYLLLFFLLPVFCNAQEHAFKTYDFDGVDVETVDTENLRTEIDTKFRAVLEDSLVQLYQFVERTRYKSGYVSFDIGYESSTASLTHLNIGLQELGFGEITETFGGVPWGGSWKKNRWLFTYLFAPGLKNSTTNNDFRVEVEGMSLDISTGYDVLNLKRFQLYPQLRLGLQEIEINIRRLAAAQNMSDLDGIVMMPAHTSIERSSLPLTYGVEADYHLLYSPGSGGIILAMKYGLTTELVAGNWKHNKEKIEYSSADRIRESSFTILLRFYFKN